MLQTTIFLKNNMFNVARKGFINATDVADYLVKKGLSFRIAYKIVGFIVAYAIDHDEALDTMNLSEYQDFSKLFDSDIYQSIDLKKAVKDRTVIGGPVPDTVKKHVEVVKEFLKNI